MANKLGVVVKFPASFLYQEELALVLCQQMPSEKESEKYEQWEDICYAIADAFDESHFDIRKFLRDCGID